MSTPHADPERGGSHSHPAKRLAGEASPYLLQHAHNPVDWHPWAGGATDCRGVTESLGDLRGPGLSEWAWKTWASILEKARKNS
jgi:hypothetical protein